MNILFKRKDDQRRYNSDDYDALRLKEVKQERCGICYDLWPSSMMATEDGLRRCPDCLAIRTEEVKVQIRAQDTARIASRQTRPQPPSFRTREGITGTITSMTDANGVAITQNNPLGLTKGGASKTLTLHGISFASTDTVSASTGITVTPVTDSSTQVTLTVSAGGGMAAGDYYHLTYNGTTQRGIFRVR